jgi:transposase
MPLSHVSAKWGLSWQTVRRAELCPIERWERTTPQVPLTKIGVDEKWLGRRHKRKEKFVTLVSDLTTGVPVWLGYGRDSETLKCWLDSLSAERKAAIELFATDTHEPFKKAIRDDPALAHAALVHDPFHIIKRAGEAVTELRRSVFFRAGPELRAIGKGTRWLVLRAWQRQSDEQRASCTNPWRNTSRASWLWSSCVPRPAVSRRSTTTGKRSCSGAAVTAIMPIYSRSSASSLPTQSATPQVPSAFSRSDCRLS